MSPIKFQGKFEHKIDAKGRVSVPAPFQKMLSSGDEDGNVLCFTTTFDDCLEFYPKAVWDKFTDKLSKLDRFNPMVKQLKQVYVANVVTDVTLDSSGRILIPQSMRNAINLEKEVVWVGSIETFELWSLEKWNATQEAVLKDPEAIGAAMKEFGLSLS